MSSSLENPDRRHILVLSQGVPPRLSGSATTILNLSHLFGQSEMTIAGERTLGAACIVPSRPRVEYLIREWLPGLRGRGRLIELALLARIAIITCNTLRLAQEIRPTEIVAVFPDEAFLCAGYLAAKMLDVDFYPYFHNTYLENREGTAKVFAEFLQANVFREARHVFVMSDGMLEYFRERYPDLKSCSALVHSLAGPIPDFESPPDIAGALRFGMLGTINASCLDAARRMRAMVESIPLASLNLFSPVPSRTLEKMGMIGSVVSCSVPAPSALASALKGNQILLLPHGLRGGLSPVEYKTIFPTRTIDYLVSGRPILAHVPKESFLWSFLRRNECALVVDEPSVGALAAAAERIRLDADLRTNLVKNALRAAELFSGEKVRAELLSRMRLRAS